MAPAPGVLHLRLTSRFDLGNMVGQPGKARWETKTPHAQETEKVRGVGTKKTTTTKASKTSKTSKTKTTKSRKADIRAVLAEFGFPSGPGKDLCFTAEGAALFERGYPELRIVTEEAVSADRAFELAEKALDAIDPCFRIRVPAAIARSFLLGYRVGPLLFVDANHSHENAKLRVERANLMRSDRQIDQTLLNETLEEHGFGMGDTYSNWRWPKVLYLYEHFIGSEKVARSVLKFLLLAANETKRWGFAGEDPYRTNAAAHHIALAREIAAIFKALGERLRKAANREAEVEAIRDAYEAYAEARSAAGDPIPEAYFTHRFGDFGLGKWAMLAADSID